MKQAMSTSSHDKYKRSSRQMRASGFVAGLIHGVNVTELAAQDWNIELIGWEGVLENGEGTGQMVESMNRGGTTAPGAHSGNHFHAGGTSMLTLPCKWELG